MNARLHVIDGRIVTNDHRPFDCSNERDWIGRDSGYADFADDHVFDSRGALLQGVNNNLLHFEQGTCDCNGDPPSYSVDPPSYNAVPPSCNAVAPNCCSVDPSFCNIPRTNYNNDLSSRNVVPTSCNFAATPCNISQFSCNVAPSPSMQSPQLVSSNTTTSARCHINGPIDVEDLALYFDGDNKSTGCSSQVVSQPLNRARVKYGPCTVNKQGHLEEEPSQSCASLGCNDWYEARANDPFLNFCTEERWLQCPASDRCPLYNDPYVIDPNVLPPCLYENPETGSIGSWSYAYSDDGQFLEDYL